MIYMNVEAACPPIWRGALCQHFARPCPHDTLRLGSPWRENSARFVGEKQAERETHRQKPFSLRLLRPISRLFR